MTKAHERLHHLDGIRGIAALAVVASHTAWPNHVKGLGFASAGLWVDFFFVLSGFVIAYNYQRKLAQGFGIGRYMWKRMARIYPAHLAILFAMLGYEFIKLATQSSVGFQPEHQAFGGNNSFSTFLASLALLHGMGLYDTVPWNGPSWSISTEAWTYLLFGAAFAWLKLRVRAVIAFTLAVILLSYVAIVSNPTHQYMSVEADFGFFRCLIGFGMGVIAFYTWSAVPKREAGPGMQVAQLLLMAGAIVAAGLVIPKPITLAAPLLYFALITSLSIYRRGVVERVLRIRPIQFLGQISYSLYISHVMMVMLVNTTYRKIAPHLGGHFSPEQIGDFTMLVYLPMSILFGWLVWRFVETPANAWLTRSRAPERPAVDPAF